MQRMCKISIRVMIVLVLVVTGALASQARGDLIRSTPSRSFPDIAGDIVGAQTYTYDPVTQTGTFQVENAPHLISLGPAAKDMVAIVPERDGTLSQSLSMKLDRHGRLVDSPSNKFQIRGTVVIGERTYQGLLLEGTPTAFGAEKPDGSPSGSKTGEVFDLNVKITDGELARAFGSEAYLRITPQADSTFSGEFTVDFSSTRPLTNLRASRKSLPAAVPEPTLLVSLLTCGAGVLALRLRRLWKNRQTPRRGER
jgi:hypothetical protein